MEFDWRRVVIKDYSTVFAWISAALALFAYEAVHNVGLSAARPRILISIVLFLVLIVIVLAVRYAKKSGRLKEQTTG